MSRISKVGASLRTLMCVSMLALAAGCAADSSARPEASARASRAALALLEGDVEGEASASLTATDDVSSCAAREEAACFGAGGSCELATAAFVGCAETQGCFDADGIFDEACAYERCASETDAFGICVYDSCEAYLACFEGTGSSDGGTPPEPSACEAAASACVEGPCTESYQGFVGCAIDAGCIDELGVYDEECALARCGAEASAYSECVGSSCPDVIALCDVAGAPVEEPAPVEDCDAAYEACFGAGGSCEAQWTPYERCATDCIDALGVFDEACAAERCSAEIAALYECLPLCSLPVGCS